MAQPEGYIGGADKLFDEDNKLVSPPYRATIEFVISVETPIVGRTLDVYFCWTASSALPLASARAVL
jgi:hypothetical protein